MHDKLFSDQTDFSREKINKMAESLGINMDIFSQCIDSGKYNTKISQDLEAGLKAGVKGTPTIFVNGAKFQGVVPKDILQQIFYAVELESKQNK
jgi:protein-disulfide isomerase